MSWYTARELAELALPGLPATKRKINDLATRENWAALDGCARQREGRGGGFEYSVAVLPEPARAELERRQASRALEALAVQNQGALTGEPAGALVAPNARQILMMQARASLLMEIERRMIAHDLTQRQASLQLLSDLDLARKGLATSDAGDQHEADYPALITACGLALDRKSGLSLRTLYLWFSARQDGIRALAPKQKKAAVPIQDLPWFPGFLKFYARPAKPTVAEALADYTRTLADPSLAPSAKQVRTALAKLGAVDRHRGREGAQALKARLAYVSRSTDDLMPTSVYTADGKTFDAEIAHLLTGQPFRPELTSVLDVATRKCVGFSVSLKENCIAVADALRMASCAHGIPAIFYVDNGPGYKNKTLDGDVTGMLGQLGITKMHSRAYNSQARGIIERFNRSVWNPLARKLPTYVGRDMDREARKRVFTSTRRDLATSGSSPDLMGWERFLEVCQAVIDAYNEQPHTGLPKIRDAETGRERHMSPNECWQRHIEQGFEPVHVAHGEADELFRPHVVRTVRRCLIEWNTNTYFHLDLTPYHGMKVAVGIDIKDGSKVWVREIDKVDGTELPGRLICVAAFAGNEARYVPKSFEDAAIERRANAQLRLVGQKADRIEQQLRSTLLLEASDDQSSRTLPCTAAGSEWREPLVDGQANKREDDRGLVLIEGAPEVEQPAAPAKRRVFASDVDLAAFAVESPECLTENQKKILRGCLSRRTDLDLFRLSGVDVDALRDVLRAAA